ncbi:MULTISPECIES: helix-turn-helix transcriptional regulator [Xanthomonas]|uniref:Helix-turn-helix transcriptional regulator n=3 Tax=Xanthomonas TaxID=338 RepID=A0AA46SUG5_9XANT|nr:MULTISPECIES: helix-turn-helix transcriptional regulator [Xanthomonas]MDQ7760625.1 helix-turn-helix transcriptional regulator [Xanthomonas sontii]MDY4282923.1 helix-turn-helix transcriptional regulator [Xanthomonas sp. LF06-19]MDY4298145.1 helix-turn-helix transcriptional regulator [Xanthomonas sp. LF02-5]MDY4341421.1 helix-turn-helix transcriptional regulator [Xanthomonas sp. LF07-6]MDY4359940.1 helix-turn-helix transcriptional regulator [Xanthomonas sp. LF04-12]
MAAYDRLSPLASSAITSLGDVIRRGRRARTMTQEELAERARVSRLTVLKIESGNPGVAIWAWVSVMEVLGLLGTLQALHDPVAQAMDAAHGRRVRKRDLRKKLDF